MKRIFTHVIYITLLFASSIGASAQNQWAALNGPYGGTVERLYGSGSTLYMKSGWDYFRSTDAGNNWSKINTMPSQYIYDLAISGTKIYALEYSRLYVSENGGSTWQTLSSNQFFGVFEMKVSPQGVIFVNGWNGLYVSINQGESWVQIEDQYIRRLVVNSQGHAFYFSEVYEDDEWKYLVKRILFPGAGNPYLPENIQIVLNPKQFYLDNGINRFSSSWEWDITFDSNSNIIFLDYEEILGSNNNGDAWQSLRGTSLPFATYSSLWSSRLATTPNGKIYLFRGSNNKVYVKSNYGTDNWTELADWPTGAFNDYINFVLPVSNDVILAGSANFGPFKTINASAAIPTWQSANTGMNALAGNKTFIAASGRIIYFKKYVKGFWYSDNDGSTWSFLDPGPTFNNFQFMTQDPTNINVLYAFSGSNIYTSTNSGTTWSSHATAPFFVSFVVQKSSTDFYAVMQYYDGSNWRYGIAKSSTSGLTWTNYPVSDFPEQIGMWDNHGMDATSTGEVYAQIYNYQTGEYETWKHDGTVASKMEFPVLQNEWFNFSGLHILANGHIYSGTGSAFFVSENGGESWVRQGISNQRLINVGNAIGVSRDGIFQVTQDGGKTWSNTNLAAGYITDVTKNEANNAFYASSTRSALKYTQSLIVDPSQLPPYIDFNWTAVEGGPYGGNAQEIIITNNGKQYAIVNNRLLEASAADGDWMPEGQLGNFSATNLAYHRASSTAYVTVFFNGNFLIGYREDGVGNDWELFAAHPPGDGWSRKLYFAEDGTPILYGGNLQGAFIWDAVASDWVNVSSGHTIYAVLKDSEDILYVSSNVSGVTSVHRSIDGGATWQDYQQGLENSEKFILRFREDSDGNVIAFSPNDLTILDKATNTWSSKRNNIGQDLYFGGNGEFLVGPNDEYILFSVHLKRAFKSLDKGDTWQEITFPSESALVVHATLFDGVLHASVNPSGYYYSEDLGQTWTSNTVGYGHISQSDIIHLGGDEFVISTWSDASYRTDNAGQTWLRGVQANVERIVMHEDGYLLGLGWQGLKKSTDKGDTWQTVNSNFAMQYLAFSESGITYGANYQNVYFSSDPDLVIWSQLNITGLPSNRSIHSISTDDNGGLYIVAYDPSDQRTKAYQIVFGNAIRINLEEQQSPRSVQYFNGKVYLFTSDGTLRETVDGSLWIPRSTPGGDYFTFAQNGEYWLVHGWGGVVWLSRDSGQTWQNISSSNNQLEFRDIVISPSDGRAYAATNRAVHKSGNVILPDDGTPPVITAFVPEHNKTGVSLQPTLKIIFDEVVTAVPDKQLRIHDASQSIAVPPVETILTSSGIKQDNVYEFTTASTLQLNKTYFVTLDNGAFTDIFGNPAAGFPSSTSTWRFTTITQPVVTPTSPANNSTGVNLNTSLSVTFDKPVTMVAGKVLNVYKENDFTTPVEVIATESGVVEGNTITFTRSEILDFSTVYVVKFDDNAFSAGGTNQFSALNTNTSWKFTTRSIPTVSSKTPAYDANNVPINTAISLTFNEAVLKDGEKNVSIYKASQAATPVVTYKLSDASQSGNTITIAPNSSFEHSTDYFIRVDGEAFSVQGKAFTVLNTDTDWKFKTIAAPDQLAPDITAPSPIPNLDAGASSRIINFTINDNVAVTEAKVFYRGIITNSSATFTELPIATPGGSSTSLELPASAYDGLGVEFYVTATDAAGNASRSPSTTSQYHYSYKTLPNSVVDGPSIGLPGGGTVTSYRIRAVSYELLNTGFLNVLGLNAYNKEVIRIFKVPAGTSSTATNPYQELNTSGFTGVQRGEGYFINTKEAVTFSIQNASTPKNNRNSLFSFTLKPGWNMIGNPYPLTIDWNIIRAGNNNISALNTYDIGGWGSSPNGQAPMASNTGGLVFVSGSTDINLQVPIPGISTGGRIDNIHPGSRLDNVYWELPITLQQGEIKNELPGIGMHPEASELFDRFDNPTLPRFFDFAEINFARDEPMAPYFTKDVVPTQNEYVWEFSVASNQEGLATISWDNSDLGSAKDLVLFDVSKQLIVDMKAKSSYTFDPKNSSLFRIHFGDNLGESLKPDYVMLGNIYPNPSQGEAIVPFAISAEAGEAAILIELYNNLGVKVGTLVDGKFVPGFHEAPIDAKSRGLSNGMYLIKLSVAGEKLRETHYTKWVLNK
jgi:photosystem II stability/assembly factor-like uncharacterized protein